MCSTQSCTSFLQCRVIRSHRRRVYVCLVVTCHMHFWKNDMDLLHATAVTRGWNKHRNESQHRKLTLEKKILPPLAFLPRLEPETFRSRVRSFTTELFPLRACHHRSKSVIGKYICQNSSHTQIPFSKKINKKSLKKKKKKKKKKIRSHKSIIQNIQTQTSNSIF